MIKIYNTLTRQKEDFIPIKENEVSMYVCGPTVYDFIHIGNARPMIVFDTVRRYFQYKGYKVNYVSNFTDIDDKIINKAIKEGTTANAVATKFIAECKKDMEGMNILPATHHPLATEEIQGMIDLISTLIEKGHAYEKNGTVYFRTLSFDEYGKLSHKKLEDLRSGERSINVSGQDEKESSLDFVLWKPKKEGEPFWESPWSEGRPGWHTECSVMSAKYLGKNIDIHAGGEDLVFPHHENEIAQSECAFGGTFARYWMHNAFLKLNNVKMSKSLGNFFTVREISKLYDLQILRFFMLNAHYRNPLNFSEELMQSAKTSYERIQNCYENLKSKIDNYSDNFTTKTEIDSDLKAVKEKFEASMDDDFNTADAITAIFDLVKLINKNLEEGMEVSLDDYKKMFDLLNLMSDVLGLKFERNDSIDDEEINNLIEERNAARKNKDFKRADEIRDMLKDKGILLEDTREGVKWKKI